MNCSCSISTSYEGSESSWGVQTRKAAKVHRCCECRTTITKGEKYFYHTVFGDGTIGNYKMCSACNSILESFFTSGWMFGFVLEDLEYHLEESWIDDLPSSCISKLAPGARDMVCDYLQRWQE